MAISAVAVPAAASIGGSLISANGAENAADTQAQAAQNSQNFQQGMYNQTQANLKPYLGIGNQAVNALTTGTGLDTSNPLGSALLKAPTMTESQLESTPGYQFNLNQGLKGVQNGAAARGLGTSGAALKGAGAYATGLADSTYQNQFNNAVTNQTNQFNRLQTLAGGGQNAAVSQGGFAGTLGSNIGSTIQGAGNSQAASQISGANALNQGLQGAGNQVGVGLNNGLYGNQGNNNIYGSNFTTAPQGSDYSNNAFYNSGTYDPQAGANGLQWSDIRLKKNIIPAGEENGYPLYEFQYLWSPIRYIGVMAQDVMKKNPEAVLKFGKFMAVNYEKLGIQLRSVA